MYPILIKFGKLAIYTYGLFVAISFLVGIKLAKFEAKRQGEDPNKIMDISFYILIAGIIGSRLFYVISSPELFYDDPIEIFRIWNGGLVFYGGFLCALIASLIYMKKVGMYIWKTADIFAPSIAIGHFFGRIGCFFAGCCYGKKCDLPWAITFTHPDSLAPIGVPLHPTQIYSALNNLLIFIFLWFFVRRRKQFDGQVFWVYVLIYGITRSIIEIFRGDFRGLMLFNLISISQIIGFSMSIISVIILIFLSKRASKEIPT